MFRSLIDFFIPKTILPHDENYRAARILVTTLLVTSLASLLSIGEAFAVDFHHVKITLLTSSILSIIAAFLFRRGLPFVFVVRLFITNNAIIFFLQSWWGGGLEAPATIALFLLPCTTMMLTGKKDAVFWLIFVNLIVCFFYVYEDKFGQLPILYDTSKTNIFMFGSLLGIILCLFVIILVFDSEKNDALQSLVTKNEELKATQNQLIQKEKLASLGELTAGIAHEIQNPLNFVNNFSELSVEIAKELSEEIVKDNIDKDLVKDLISYLTSNQDKINQHGKRASGIVTGMLEHARMPTGERQLTDINHLADEYLRLSYHGLRAKDKDFNADFTTDFDKNLPKIEVIPQDIGRVLLNLFNNAFYASLQKAKLNIKDYQPMVTVTTQQINKHIVIKVKDNGTGIPESVRAKVFHPFFTTKPTGQGTGLGLSISYDIITKGHGGTLEVETKEGEYTIFIIKLT